MKTRLIKVTEWTWVNPIHIVKIRDISGKGTFANTRIHLANGDKVDSELTADELITIINKEGGEK